MKDLCLTVSCACGIASASAMLQGNAAAGGAFLIAAVGWIAAWAARAE